MLEFYFSFTVKYCNILCCAGTMLMAGLWYKVRQILWYTCCFNFIKDTQFPKPSPKFKRLKT